MKFIHTADLHIGKIVNDFSMIEEQRNILNQIIEIAIVNKVDAVVIAGDVYDRSVPPSEAVGILDNFLTTLVEKKIKVLIVSGNHDSPERLSFANDILQSQGVYIAGNYNGDIKKVELNDEYGKTNFILLPFIKNAVVKSINGGEIITQQDAVKSLMNNIKIDTNERNVMITHYFVTDTNQIPELSDSEVGINVGGIDNVDAANFIDYDYTALGHIHGPQQISENNIYYSGSPLKYSFSEVNQNKCINLVELKEKGNISIEKIKLTPIHDMRKIKGNLNELIKEEIYSKVDTNDYICATLTDDDDLLDPIGTLRTVYPNVMQVIIEKNQRNVIENKDITNSVQRKTTYELFEDFYKFVTDKELEGARKDVVLEAIKKAEDIDEK